MIGHVIARARRRMEAMALRDYRRVSPGSRVLRGLLAVETLENTIIAESDRSPWMRAGGAQHRPVLSIITLLSPGLPWKGVLAPLVIDSPEGATELLLSADLPERDVAALRIFAPHAVLSPMAPAGRTATLEELAKYARGDFLLILPAGVRGGVRIVHAALSATSSFDPELAAMGGLLIDCDCQIREAGMREGAHGTPEAFGKGEDASRPEFQFRRPTIAICKAPMLVRREAYEAVGGFDPALATHHVLDLSLKLAKNGYRIVYEPTLLGVDLREGLRFAPFEWVRHRKEVRAITSSHAATTVTHRQNMLARAPLGRILFIDDRVPHPFLGRGLPRSHLMLLLLREFGYAVTFLPLMFPDEAWSSVYRDVPRDIEVQTGVGRDGLEDFLRENAARFDLALVSRPHNMQAFRTAHERARVQPPMRVLYDAEALFTLRDIAHETLRGNPPSAGDAEARINAEIALTHGADGVLAVTDAEGAHFRRRGVSNVATLGHAVTINPTPATFRERRGFLFVGPLIEPVTPNADGLLWFASNVLPRLAQMIGGDVRLHVAGELGFRPSGALADPHIEYLGRVDDLTSLFDRARVFIAPIRFAAGIPLKILEAAAQGVPVVTTTLLSSQLNWTAGQEVMCGDSGEAFAEACARLHEEPDLWAHVRDTALQRVRQDASRSAFAETLQAAVRATMAPSVRGSASQ